MNVAVLSGKGGTGKTFAAVNLAAVAEEALYADCDVEGPNGHFFFKPQGVKEKIVCVPVPVVDESRCVGCRACVSFCKYNALAFVGGRVKVFANLCHSCGGCMLACPVGAVTEEPRRIGAIRLGTSGGVTVLSGELEPGEASGVPVVREVLRGVAAFAGKNAIIDCPPGSACNVTESLRGADFCLFVAEPTVYGAHNLAMVHELAALCGKPYAALLNKCLPDFGNPSLDFCREHAVPVLGAIPYSPELAAINAGAKVAAHELEPCRAVFAEVWDAIRREGCGT